MVPCCVQRRPGQSSRKLARGCGVAEVSPVQLQECGAALPCSWSPLHCARCKAFVAFAWVLNCELCRRDGKVCWQKTRSATLAALNGLSSSLPELCFGRRRPESMGNLPVSHCYLIFMIVVLASHDEPFDTKVDFMGSFEAIKLIKFSCCKQAKPVQLQSFQWTYFSSATAIYFCYLIFMIAAIGCSERQKSFLECSFSRQKCRRLKKRIKPPPSSGEQELIHLFVSADTGEHCTTRCHLWSWASAAAEHWWSLAPGCDSHDTWQHLLHCPDVFGLYYMPFICKYCLKMKIS